MRPSSQAARTSPLRANSSSDFRAASISPACHARNADRRLPQRLTAASWGAAEAEQVAWQRLVRPAAQGGFVHHGPPINAGNASPTALASRYRRRLLTCPGGLRNNILSGRCKAGLAGFLETPV